MRGPASLVHAAACWLLVASVVAHAALAAFDGALTEAADTTVGLLALAVVISGVVAGVGGRRSAITFGLVLLYFAQSMVAAAPIGPQPQAAVRSLLVLALFGGAVLYAERASRMRSSPVMPASNLALSGRGK